MWHSVEENDVPGRRRLRPEELFVQVFKATIERLGGDPTLTASDWRVMAVCLGGIMYGGHIQYTQKQIALKACISPAQVSRNLEHLRTAGVLFRDRGPKGHSWRYRFNTNLAYMGDTAGLLWKRAQDQTTP